MADIFGNSFLTISATISSDAFSGIFSRVPSDAGHVEVPHPFDLDKSTGVFVRRAIPHNQFGELNRRAVHALYEWNEEYPLLERAWAYQEQILPPRVVHFGRHEIVWLCNEASWCCCKDGNNGHLHAFKANVSHHLNPENSDKDSPERRVLECWKEIVQNYSNKDLTHEGDRLSALSGIAQRYQRVRKGRYLAGLWEDNLVGDLCWSAAPTGRRSSKYLAPSWSWCSVFAPVSWLTGNKLDRIDVRVEEVVCTPATSDPTGAISSGHLRLTGVLIKGQAHRLEAPYWFLRFWIDGREFKFHADAHQDDLPAIRACDGELYALGIGYEKSVFRPALNVLILLKVVGEHDTYRRVGLGILYEDHWRTAFEGAKSTITII